MNDRKLWSWTFLETMKFSKSYIIQEQERLILAHIQTKTMYNEQIAENGSLIRKNTVPLQPDDAVFYIISGEVKDCHAYQWVWAAYYNPYAKKMIS